MAIFLEKYVNIIKYMNIIEIFDVEINNYY